MVAMSVTPKMPVIVETDTPAGWHHAGREHWISVVGRCEKYFVSRRSMMGSYG